MIQPGTIFADRYEILNHIGSGGMADVYRAKCHKLNRYVAVKVLRKEHNEDEEFVRRFIAEAQATAGFTHPNIVGIYDAGVDQGYHYIVMELCEGTTLKRYIRRYGRLSVRETVDFAMQIARGIEAAHQEGIIHRDINHRIYWFLRVVRSRWRILELPELPQVPPNHRNFWDRFIICHRNRQKEDLPTREVIFIRWVSPSMRWRQEKFHLMGKTMWQSL